MADCGSGLVPEQLFAALLPVLSRRAICQHCEPVIFQSPFSLTQLLSDQHGLCEEALFDMGTKHLILSPELHENLGLFLAPNMPLLQLSLHYSSHIGFYTKDEEHI